MQTAVHCTDCGAELGPEVRAEIIRQALTDDLTSTATTVPGRVVRQPDGSWTGDEDWS